MTVNLQSWLHNLDDEHGYFVSDTDTGLTMHFCDGEVIDGLVLDTRLQAIADAWWGMTEEHQIAIGEICEGYEDDAALDVLLDTLKRTALTEENKPVSKFAHGKRDHDELIESGLLDPDQSTEYAMHQTHSDVLTEEEK